MTKKRPDPIYTWNLFYYAVLVAGVRGLQILFFTMPLKRNVRRNVYSAYLAVFLLGLDYERLVMPSSLKLFKNGYDFSKFVKMYVVFSILNLMIHLHKNQRA